MPRNQRHNVDVQQVPRTEAETHEEGDGKAIFLNSFFYSFLYLFLWGAGTQNSADGEIRLFAYHGEIRFSLEAWYGYT